MVGVVERYALYAIWRFANSLWQVADTLMNSIPRVGAIAKWADILHSSGPRIFVAACFKFGYPSSIQPQEDDAYLRSFNMDEHGESPRAVA